MLVRLSSVVPEFPSTGGIIFHIRGTKPEDLAPQPGQIFVELNDELLNIVQLVLGDEAQSQVSANANILELSGFEAGTKELNCKLLVATHIKNAKTKTVLNELTKIATESDPTISICVSFADSSSSSDFNGTSSNFNGVKSSNFNGSNSSFGKENVLFSFSSTAFQLLDAECMNENLLNVEETTFADFSSSKSEGKQVLKEAEQVKLRMENMRLEEEREKKNAIFAKKFGTVARSITFDVSASSSRSSSVPSSQNSSFLDVQSSSSFISQSSQSSNQHERWSRNDSNSSQSEPLSRNKRGTNSNVEISSVSPQSSKIYPTSLPTSPNHSNVASPKVKPFKTKSMASLFSSKPKKKEEKEERDPNSKRQYLSSSSILPHASNRRSLMPEKSSGFGRSFIQTIKNIGTKDPDKRKSLAPEKDNRRATLNFF